jgi:RNA polymerase sigma factor for flagellar operon FliA
MYCGEEQQAPDNAYSRTEMRQFKERLRQLVEELPEQERTVIYGHYLQQQPFEQMAQRLSLSKGRVSQIHASGLTRLRRIVSGSE